MNTLNARSTEPLSMRLRFSALRLGASLLAAGTAALLALSAGAAAAQSSYDPPGRAARLAVTEGQVWLYHPDQGEWVSANINRPLTSGDRLATDRGARAEVEIGSTTVRIDSSTELDLQAIDDDRATLRLVGGSVFARVYDVRNAGRVEVATDAGRFVVQRAGVYRIDHVDGASHATVYQGQARYEGPNSGLALEAGQRAEFWIDGAGIAQYATSAPVSDEFAAWNNARDRRPVGNIGSRYVSPEMTGAYDLDRYGRWEQNVEYGALWIPTNVGPNWAPYSHGHWTWVAPWGWTWIDDAPWGFAPFHYGRWVNVRDTWCWTPGARVVRPVYAPALVAWVGGSRGGAGPAVGWFPLAPREVYVPSYRVSPRYARNINITHVDNTGHIDRVINNPLVPRQFENRRYPQAVTVVPANVLTERRPVAPASADFRRSTGGREFAQEPGRHAVIVAPQVSPPPLVARGEARGPIAPAPGFGDRPVGGGSVQSPRDRDRRGDDRRDAERGAGVVGDRAVPPGTWGAPVRPQAAPPFGANANPLPQAPPARVAPRAAQPAPAVQPQAQPQPQPQLQSAPNAQPAPEMRPMPMRPSENRREMQRPLEERRVAPAPMPAPAAVAPAPPATVERAPQAQRVAPQAPPEMRRAQPPQQAEPAARPAEAAPRAAEPRREPMAPREPLAPR